MTLLVTVFAAIISTILWYQKENRKELRLGTLSLMYWGASIMWFVDAIFEYAELHAAYFTPDPMDMLNDLSLIFFFFFMCLNIFFNNCRNNCLCCWN